MVYEIGRLEELTNRLLEFVRFGSIEPVPTNPVQLLQQTVQRLRSDRVQVQALAAPVTWNLDPLSVQRALSNLVENALQITPEHSDVFALVREERGNLLFEVRDAGKGVPQAKAEALFQPFVSNRSRGTGLGLALAQRVAEAHGGRLRVRNAPEGGAIFSLSLPRR